MHNSSN